MIIQLTKGYEAVIDEVDFDLSLYPWQINIKSLNGRTLYAQRAAALGAESQLHRVILSRVLGRALQSEEDTDHIDRNGLNNRRNNLRLATRSQNMANNPKQRGNYSSEYKGVSWYSSRLKWRSYIKIQRRMYTLGYFEHEIDAAIAYDNAAISAFGIYAFTNIINK